VLNIIILKFSVCSRKFLLQASELDSKKKMSENSTPLQAALLEIYNTDLEEDEDKVLKLALFAVVKVVQGTENRVAEVSEELEKCQNQLLELSTVVVNNNNGVMTPVKQAPHCVTHSSGSSLASTVPNTPSTPLNDDDVIPSNTEFIPGIHSSIHVTESECVQEMELDQSCKTRRGQKVKRKLMDE
jgi:hypothetical protein